MPADNPLPMSCIHRLHLPLMLVCAAITVSGLGNDVAALSRYRISMKTFPSAAIADKRDIE